MTPQDFQEQAWWWGDLSLDKVSLRFCGRILVPSAISEYQTKGPITITNAGGCYWDICFHAEFLVPGVPVLHQIAQGLAMLSFRGVFQSDHALCLVRTLSPEWIWDVPHTVLYIEYLKSIGAIWAEQEVAADFHCKYRPVLLTDKSAGHRYRSSRYSNDGVQGVRLVEVNGEVREHSKGRRKDYVIEYNRGQKSGLKKPLWRIEFRLQRHHLDRLTAYDLCLDFHTWMLVRKPWLVKFLRKAIPPGCWSLREAELNLSHWNFSEILMAGGWTFY